MGLKHMEAKPKPATPPSKNPPKDQPKTLPKKPQNALPKSTPEKLSRSMPGKPMPKKKPTAVTNKKARDLAPRSLATSALSSYLSSLDL
eukprot:NODE_4180_length_689_cov_40.192188_g3548_i0.p2 GENE.NODE_4180_length_689_cov_40.192188_g3548_i0~~NODE_4180_length_689_cov_40.192188_g3548_i0.p2  ORF type:complete len:89 (-),score=23.34 NODE_4180_length_689_cov_40.192188_g3548_i0:167-433(-)